MRERERERERVVLRREWKRTCLGSSFPGLFELWNVERVDGFDDQVVRRLFVIHT